ncbi:hypothetical protein [Paraburkholderia unamae]|uniref:hypothetical protein n=1 Tax=Paraburkholderia unamae TaxID=219649 RepID=UPI001CC56BE5|nr:hypothetical protein [Paraburkholderia unamae]
MSDPRDTLADARSKIQELQAGVATGVTTVGELAAGTRQVVETLLAVAVSAGDNVQAACRLMERFDEMVCLLSKCRAATAVRRHLEAMEQDEAIRGDPVTHAVIRRGLAAMPRRLPDLDAEHVMKALATYATSKRQSHRAEKKRYPQKFANARDLIRSRGVPVSNAKRIELEKLIAGTCDVDRKTAKDWLEQIIAGD